MNINFKKLLIDDIKLLYIWLNEPEVKKWYGKNEDFSKYQLVYNKYIKYINNAKQINAFTILIDDLKIGYIQCYFIKDCPDYNLLVNLDDPTIGIDLFIGETRFLSKGYGSKILDNFITKEVFERKETNKIILGPEPGNKRAIRAFEKSGFKYLKTIKIADSNEEEYLMCYEKRYTQRLTDISNSK